MNYLVLDHFFFQDTSTRRQWMNLFGFWFKLLPAITILITQT